MLSELFRNTEGKVSSPRSICSCTLMYFMFHVVKYTSPVVKYTSLVAKRTFHVVKHKTALPGKTFL